MHATGATAPDGILVDTDGMWRMPVITGWSSRSDLDAEAYLIGSNQITTAGGWDDDLADVLRDLQASGLADLTGFTDDALTELLGVVCENPYDTMGGGSAQDADETDPEPPAEPVSRLGDRWLLADRHILICGDSTDPATWAALMGSDRADCIWTDPPYGVAYVGKTKDALTIQNDALDETGLKHLLRDSLTLAWAHANPGAAWHVAAPPGPLHAVFLDILRDLGTWRQTLIWVKDQFVLGHADYHWRHEPIFYGYTPGAAGRRGRGGEGWYGDHAQSSVLEFARPKRSEDHPTMKPVDLVTYCLDNSCPPGGMVAEPFSGSGTTLLACEITGRRARASELDPRYVDVAARRWQELSGELPYNERLGEPVDLIDGT
ncbi:MAG TPA: site-specific DNA-methyltransferase [Kineosporiaceae bacterium]